MHQVMGTIRRRAKLIVLTSTLLALTHHAWAEDGAEPSKSVSHRQISHGPSADAEQLFKERLGQLGQRDEELKKLAESLQKIMGEKQWNELLRKFQSGELKTTDPKLLDEVNKLLRKPGDSNTPILSRQQSEELTKWLHKQFPNAPLPGTANQPSGQNPTRPETPSNPSTGPQPGTSEPPSSQGKNKAKGTSADAAARARAAEQIMRWAKNMERVAGNLEDSPALQQLLRDLSQYALEMQNADLPPEQRLDTQLASFTRYLQNSESWWKDLQQTLGPINFPEMPRLNTAASRLPSVERLPTIHVPRRLGDLPTSYTGAQQLLALLVLVLIFLLVWKVAGRLVHAAVERGKAAWQLGPWPLDPAQIATRADVVQAYEYLSLLRLGYRARSLNHLEIASRLGTSVDSRQAATKLAALYEQVRYAPGDVPLSSEAIAAARRDACFLAGVPGA